MVFFSAKLGLHLVLGFGPGGLHLVLGFGPGGLHLVLGVWSWEFGPGGVWSWDQAAM